jgi:hypothetical protein
LKKRKCCQQKRMSFLHCPKNLHVVSLETSWEIFESTVSNTVAHVK